MPLKKIKNDFEDWFGHVQFNVRDYKLIHNLHLPSLTRQEIEEIKEVWPCFKFRKLDLGWSRVYKMKQGFSPYFLNDVQYVQLLKHISPYNHVVSLQNKAMCDVYFPEIPYPKALVRCLNGVLYNAEMKPLSIKEACNVLSQQSAFIIKPSLGSMCGFGVKRVLTEGKTIDDLATVIKESGSNFIAQMAISQHSDIQKLNDTSLNCCRVTTIYINGKFDYSTIFKFGKRGSHIDNWNSGYLGGITKDGILKNVAYDVNLVETNQTDNGLVFGGMKYPSFDKMISVLERLHKKYFANVGIVGWDVVVDAENEVKVIESNLWFAGIQGEQLCGDLFFEPFHDEILKIMSYEEN